MSVSFAVSDISRARSASVLLICIGLFTTYGLAQVNYTGSAANENFGSQSIATASVVTHLSFSIAAGTKVGSVAVLTTGVANLDFANAAGTTCAATTYASASPCTVSVTFTPKAAGLRKGAVVFFASANNTGAVLGTALLYGVGVGAQVAYGPGTVAAVDRTMGGAIGLGNPEAMTTDAAGNLFVVDSVGSRAYYRVVKIPPNGAATTTIKPVVNGAGLYLPSGIAVDGAGNLFIGDFYRRIVKVPVGGGAPTEIQPSAGGVAMSAPGGLAVDGAGNLFIGDYMNNRVLEVPPGGGVPIVINPKVNGTALNDPHGVFVDASGNLFIADLGNDRIVEVPAGSGAATAIDPEVNGRGLWNPVDVALNGAGDMFVADDVNHRVVEIPSGGTAVSAIDPPFYFNGVGEVYAVAVDGAGDLFFTQGGLQAGNNIVEEFQYGANPTVNFATLTNQGTTDVPDGAQTLEIMNSGNRPLMFSSIVFPVDFSQVAGAANGCTASSTLSPGQSCNLSIEFTPKNGGALSETVVLTDNAPSASGSQQAIKVTGTSENEASVTSPIACSVLPGPTVTFNWQAGSGATAYYLSLGSTGVGSNNIFNTGKRTVTSWAATGIPTDGRTIYARLTTYFGAIQLHADTVYTAATAAVLLSPAPNSVLPGATATFTWSPASGGTSYLLWLGTTGVGSYNLYASPSTKGTSVSVTKLPTTGVKLIFYSLGMPSGRKPLISLRAVVKYCEM